MSSILQDELVPSKGQLLKTATRYRDTAGLSVFPLENKHRIPTAWGAYKGATGQKATDAELAQWFPKYPGIGIAHGIISGNSEVLDFDTPTAYNEFYTVCTAWGIGALAESLLRVETPSGGTHLYYRCPEGIEGNQKLANVRVPVGKAEAEALSEIERKRKRYTFDPETCEWFRIETKIETRGEGGYTVAPGSLPKVHEANLPYKKLSGSFDAIPLITAQERESLFSAARSLTEYIEPERYYQPVQNKAVNTRSTNAVNRPGDDYNNKVSEADIAAILEKHGWQFVGGNRWTRPGKNPHEGHSATLGHFPGFFHVFSSSCHPFELDHAYSAFQVLALLEYGGNFTEAARDLGRKGYGEPSLPKNSNIRSKTTPRPKYAEDPKAEAYAAMIQPGEVLEAYQWPDLHPFGTEVLPSFPPDALPDVLANAANAFALSVGTPFDMPAMQMLAAVAATIQKRVAVKGKPDHAEPVSLWCVTIAPPGSRKSAIIAKVRAPLAEYEIEQNLIRKPYVEESESEIRRLRKRLERAENAAAKGDPDVDTMAELYGAREALRNYRETFFLRLLADDATPEAIALLQSQNGGRLAVLDSEGVIFNHMMGRYTDKPAIEVLLKGHAGESFTQDRAGKDRKAIAVSHAALTLGVTIQPGILDSMRGKKEVVGVGGLARCLFSFPQYNGEGDDYETPAVDASAERAYRALIQSLLKLEPSTERDGNEYLPHFLTLTDEARALFRNYYKEIHAAIDAEGGGAFAEWLAKLHGATLRIAGVLHMAHHGTAGVDAGNDRIDTPTIANAVKIARYLTAHAEAAFARAREDESEVGAKKILAWVRRNAVRVLHLHESGGVSLHELRQQLRHFATDTELTEALELLAERGYVLPVAPEERTGPGRKPSIKWQFHPSLLNSGYTEVTA